MKREARGLASSCTRRVCVGIVVRGPGLDGLAVAPSCAALCLRLEERGYLYELRYAVGECTCGLPRPPRITAEVEAFLSFARRAAGRVEDLLITLHEADPSRLGWRGRAQEEGARDSQA